MEKQYRVLPDHIDLTAIPRGAYRHRVRPPRGVKFERLLEVDCWDVVSDKFLIKEEKHQGQVVEVYPEDGAYFAELLAIKLGSGQVKMKKLRFHELTAEPKAPKDPEFEVKLRGPKKWSILRKRDKSVIIDGIDTREEAEEKLKDYIEELES